MDSDLSTIEAGSRPSGARSTRVRARRIVGLTAVCVLIAGALVHPVATLLSRSNWRAELFSHFQLLGLAVTLTAMAATVLRSRWLAALLAVAAVLQAIPLFRYSGPNPVPPTPLATARLRILMANLLVDNTDYDALSRLIRRERPDIVGLVEFSPEWRDGLAGVRSEFPYRVEAPYGTLGLAFWFREPPRKTGPPEWLLPTGAPFLHAEVDFDGQPRHLWLIHPKTPLIRRGAPELPALAGRFASTGGSQIVIGDLNSSEGSPLFADFLKDARLRDTRLGFGRQPSWPAGFPLFRIAIDHAFVSNDLAVADRRLGPDFGSDHFPLILDLAPASARSAESSSSSPAQSEGGSGGAKSSPPANLALSAALRNATSRAARSGPR
jgi:endonuclease/exonuclease/phosphatase (EEP) superfamily protein YafD